MNDPKKSGLSTLTVILAVLNIALAVLIAVSWFRDTSKPEGMDLPGIVTTPPTAVPETPAVNTPKPEKTPVPTELPSAAPASSAYPEVAKDPEGRRPGYEDFDWYLTDVRKNGVWSDAERIMDPGEVMGEWKAYILFDPNRTGEESCEMLFNADISAEQNGMDVLCDWYYIRYFAKDEGEYQEGVSHFRGPWNDGGINASGPGTMELYGFWEKDGKMYGLGFMNAKDGTPAEIALVRP